MIFPTDSILKVRGELEDRVAAGELSEADAYRQALALDPDDARALRLLALLAEDQGDLAGARELAFRWLNADPLSHEAFRLIGRLLTKDPAEAPRAAAYLALGIEKLHFDPESEEDPHPAEPSPDEPAAVTRELEPHRLLHAMWIASTGELDPAVIDRVLAIGPEIAPLLKGVLNLFGEDLLEEVDDALLARSLALLGEIGDPAAVPGLARFLPLEDETLGGAAGWAIQRIAMRKPGEVLRVFVNLIPEADPMDLASLAQQLCTMPDTPGRREALLAMEARLPEFDAAGRALVLVSIITSALVMEGTGSELAAGWERQYGADIPPDARKELKEIRKQLKDAGPYVAEEDSLTIQQICCPGFEAAEEDSTFTRQEPKLGRNDPCWCGSGKKYKKCHLAEDEHRQ